MSNKIIRTICLFTNKPTIQSLSRLSELTEKAISKGFNLQTQRLCSASVDELLKLDDQTDGSILLSIGSLTFEKANEILEKFYNTKNVAFNIDLSNEKINKEHTKPLMDIIQNNPSKTFNFTYTFNNNYSSPYFPSASYKQDGFSIGLQPTNLSEGCKTVEEWLERMKEVWIEIDGLFSTEEGYLGIDTSIAPLFKGNSSFIDFIKRTGSDFEKSVTTDTFLKITKFIEKECPKSVGLCGLMFPCLEDFELAKEYEAGNFTIERNVFLSLHSGLGIDTYPIGINEKPERVLEILKLIQSLSNKYKKPLSVRFVSDGKARIGDKTNFQNQYLKDVNINQL